MVAGTSAEDPAGLPTPVVSGVALSRMTGDGAAADEGSVLWVPALLFANGDVVAISDCPHATRHEVASNICS
jgi:hypothetical protein